MTCPKCDSDIDALIATPWGTGPKNSSLPPSAPYICSWCGSLLMIVFSSASNPELVDAFGEHPELLDIIKTNRALSDEIDRTRKVILSLPNRKPVLR